MARLLYSAAMSLDGFIAGPGGDMSWLADYLEPNPVVDELIPQVGALLVGARTFRGDEPVSVTSTSGTAPDFAVPFATPVFFELMLFRICPGRIPDAAAAIRATAAEWIFWLT